MSPPRTGCAGPLKGAPSVARQSRFHDGRWVYPQAAAIEWAAIAGVLLWQP